MLPYIIILAFGSPAILTLIDFIYFLITRKRLYHVIFTHILDTIVMLGLPGIYLLFLDENQNNCCSASATFSPDHKPTIYFTVAVCAIAFLISRFKTRPSGPVTEVMLNALLLLGLVLNILVAIQINSFFFLFGNLPIVLLYILQLIENHRKFLELNPSSPTEASSIFEKAGWNILTANPFLKIPILLVICIPVLTLIICLLLLFGQKPDSFIRAFTDTYKHGFSQLDYMCDNVSCGDHFLCSVAANGHRGVVKPTRYGERNNNKIICNRQLLVANAFEELIEQKLPRLHKFIRRNYNKVGNMIHRHYTVFNNKLVADSIYILMKPLEWLFLLVLYAFDARPENRIAQQYLSRMDRQKISAGAGRKTKF